MRSSGALLALLSACAAPIVAPPEVPSRLERASPCGEHGVTVSSIAALNEALAGDAPEVWVAHGTYGAVVVERSVRLFGLGASGACAPAAGSDGPTLSGLTARGSGVQVAGFRVGGPVVVRGANVQRLTVWGRGTCVDADEGAHVEGLVVSACDTGVRLAGGSVLRGSVIAHNRGDGVLAEGPALLDQLTLAENAGAGARFRGGGQRLANLQVTGNGDWGLFEDDPFLFGAVVSFHNNSKGHYGSARPALDFPSAWYSDDVLSAPQILPGDRYSTEPMLLEGGLRAASRALTPPWPSLPERPADHALDVATAEAAWRASRPLRPAWVLVEGGTDVRGEPRAATPCIGAFETCARPPVEGVLLVTPEGDDAAAGTLVAPLRTLRAALERAQPGQTIWVATGRYAETLSLRGQAISLQGVAWRDGAWVELLDPDDPDLPVLDVANAPSNEHGIYLVGVSREARIRGLAIEGAMQGLVVSAGDEQPRRGPRLEALRLANNRVGILVVSGSGELSHSRITNNADGVRLLGSASWDIGHNHFDNNGTAVALGTVMSIGFDPFVIHDNRFEGGGVALDNLASRDGQVFTVTANTFHNAWLVIGHGDPGTQVVVSHNTFTSGGIVVEGRAWSVPAVTFTQNALPGGAFLTPGQGWPQPSQAVPDRLAPLPPPPDVSADFTASDRVVQPHSRALVADAAGTTLYGVAPDHDGVSVYATQPRLERTQFYPTGPDPRGLVLTPDGKSLVVANFAGRTLTFVDLAAGTTADLDVGSAPFGLVVDPDGKHLYVSVSGDAELAVVDLATRAVVRRVPLGHSTPRGLSLAPGPTGPTLWVTHFMPGRRAGAPVGGSAELVPRVSILDLPDLSGLRSLELPPIASEGYPPVVPVQLASVVVRGHRAYLASSAAYPESPGRYTLPHRGLPRFLAATHGTLTVVDTRTEAVLTAESANLGVAGQVASGPSHVTFTPEADVAFITMTGNDQVQRAWLAPNTPPATMRPWRASMDLLVGTDPRGVVLSPDGQSVFTLNIGNVTLSRTSLRTALVAEVVFLGPPERDRLGPEARHGRQLFSSVNTAEGTSSFAMACGSCHPDGSTDGVTWTFPAGPRSTPMLAGSPDTLPLHFDADRDEIADFEHTLRELQGGMGLIYGDVPADLGEPYVDWKAEPWKHVEAYLREGVRPFPPASPRGGEARGRALFEQLRCGTCHAGPHFAAPPIVGEVRVGGGQILNTLHDVGTANPADRVGVGAFDPPSLWGLVASAPYLHDGSASTLHDVIANPRHAFAGTAGVGSLGPDERNDLVAYLVSLGPPAP